MIQFDYTIETLLNTLPDFIAFKDGEGRWILANPVALEVFHLTNVDYVGKRDSELGTHVPFMMEALRHCEATDEEVWRQGETVRGKETIPQPDGRVRIFDTIKIPTFYPDGRRKVLIVVGRDITDFVHNRKDLEESRQRYQSLYHNNPNPTFSVDLSGRITTVNAKMETLLGYTANELVGRPTSFFVSDEDVSRCEEFFRETLLGNRHVIEIGVVTKSGRQIQLEIHGVPMIVDGEVVGIYGVAQDVSDRTRAEQIIYHLAFYDPLTGLANRAMLTNRISDAIADLGAGHALAVLFIDLDHFKSLNDTRGHSMGDLLLKRVAQRLQACVPASGTICRLGGDEFIVLLPRLKEACEAVTVAKRILDTFSEPWDLGGECVYITGSIGIAMGTDNTVDAEQLIRNADMAMYDAKDKGKNTYRLFDASLSDKLQRKVKLETALRQALAQDMFTVCYQPQFDMATRRIIGAEALLRWNHPQAIYPTHELIQVAEETGLIVPIGLWVLRTVCRQAKQWREAGHHPLRIYVNVSPRQFIDNRFVHHVKRILAETDMDGHALGLEITEGVIMRDVHYAQETLQALRDMGMKIDIDDFGTGYSSLAYLKRFPIDRIKIDQSFIRDVTNNEADLAIVKTIISLAHNFQIPAIAEGVETATQFQLLKQHGCDEAQGYFLGRPANSNDFNTHLGTAH
ncbi:putative bifunctional diguanylate cyclase/phosphodiesterase [Alicyclobacillus suci]|uniref:putative bifunctional diguanylate cyclase/phosphodiesterase n=1 Tax=Alicyclobacillus suci TaxID=2816080 RepID=UPI001A8DCC3F|nr:bifunctional diguanylate cyclase/phosphodiesterase [Alicyclobacillus suci]